MIMSLNVSTSSADKVLGPPAAPSPPSSAAGRGCTGAGFTIGAIGLTGWIGLTGPGVTGCTTIGGVIGGRTGPVTIGVGPTGVGPTGVGPIGVGPIGVGPIGVGPTTGVVMIGVVMIGVVIGTIGPRQVTFATITALCASTRP